MPLIDLNELKLPPAWGVPDPETGERYELIADDPKLVDPDEDPPRYALSDCDAVIYVHDLRDFLREVFELNPQLGVVHGQRPAKPMRQAIEELQQASGSAWENVAAALDCKSRPR